jgi:hypothetical protein
MPVYALNAPPDARCDCGPNLLCTHGATAPTEPGRDHPVEPAANPGCGHNE